jgi:hypothetical protein
LSKQELRKFLKSKKALAIPVTYLILFASLMAVISATYSFAIAKISAKGNLLKTSIAKQNMQAIDDTVHSVLWSPGASNVVYMDDCGGVFHTSPTAKNLIINFTDDQTFHDIVFNSSIGKVFYEVEPSELNDDGFFVRGDSRAIVSQSTSTMTQLYFSAGDNSKELTLCYRPSANAAFISIVDEKPLNLIRVYVINFNSSQNLVLREKFYLKVTAVNVVTATKQYEFNSSLSSLALKTAFDGTLSSVWLPVVSNANGTIVNLEIVVCNIKIQSAGV